MFLLGFLDSGLSKRSIVKIQGEQVLGIIFFLSLMHSFRGLLTYYVSLLQ